ncbi:hypothetical protein F1257_16280 [Clostridioides difficile]|uniref:hypothetical protein n=1 Tax=Clostridioides difficile TaxID=1496 RepID=UPI00038D3EF5|nr:hypothetical protein [Clostridioides difficile]EGT4637068.1 hypothetical protein [Clostridioides difficile]EQJ83996.1 hypothetical protein QU9_1954 [Clostridioides difficile P48]MBH8106276.1 hypothetical protein [Clostridioides difficile]MBJ9796287.1 hypothetical protein [Clostridioides difficile]MCA0606685.1 hypothetical protein [Clostridioides difficile]
MESILDIRQMVYIIKIKIKDKDFFLTDLKKSLSNNFKDSMIFLDKNTAEHIIGDLETTFESKIGYLISCKLLTVPIFILF